MAELLKRRFRFSIGTMLYVITALCGFFAASKAFTGMFGFGLTEKVIYVLLAWVVFLAYFRQK